MSKNKKYNRILRRLTASVLLVLLLGVFLLPQFASASLINDENLIELTNKTRAEEGLNELSANQLLSKAAYQKAETIFSEQIFGHNINGRKFSDWVKDANYQYQNVGENLAIDFVSSEGTMNAWLNSPSHKKNILNPKFKEIGVAVKTEKFEGHDSILVVQIFGTPLDTNIKTNSPDTIILNLNQESISQKNQENLLTNSAPKTPLVTNTNSNVGGNALPEYLSSSNPLFGQERLSSEFVEQAVLYIIDSTNYYLMNYYWTIITLLLQVFSASFIWHKKNYQRS